MGNSQQKYYALDVARQNVGNEAWKRLISQLERYWGKQIDYDAFEKILRRRFERIPKVLCQSIYQAFTSDIYRKMDVVEFVACLTTLRGPDRLVLMKLLFNVYDYRSAGIIDRLIAEKLLLLAYGDRMKEEKEAIEMQLDAIFRPSGKKQVLSQRDFEANNGPVSALGKWLKVVFDSMFETSFPRIHALERRYSSAQEIEEAISRFRISRDSCMQLRNLFYSRTIRESTTRPEITLDTWIEWVQSFLPVPVATTIFLSKVRSIRLVWRFLDFVEFCVVFSCGTASEKAREVCLAYDHEYLRSQRWRQVHNAELLAFRESKIADCDMKLQRDYAGTASTMSPVNGEVCEPGMDIARALNQSEIRANSRRSQMRRMLLLLQKPVEYAAANARLNKCLTQIRRKGLNGPSNGPLNGSETLRTILEESSTQSSVSGTETSSSPARRSGSPAGTPKKAHNLSRGNSMNDIEFVDSSIDSILCWHADIGEDILESTYEALPPGIAVDLRSLESLIDSSENFHVDKYIDLLTQHAASLPILKQLSIVACCVFGMRPQNPTNEKEYVMELLVRRYNSSPHSNAHRHGAPGSEWCVLSKQWYDSWQFYVGQSRSRGHLRCNSNGDMMMHVPEYASRRNAGGFKDMPMQTPPSSSAEKGISVPSPSSIDNWSILQRSTSRQLLNGALIGQHLEIVPPEVYTALHAWYGGGPRILRKVISAEGGGSELELFPIILKICTCDRNGMSKVAERELLFSRSATVLGVTQELCYHRGIPAAKARLWNYVASNLHEQYIISPELTLRKAALQSGQTVMLEVALEDGTWPRSTLYKSTTLGIPSGANDGSNQVGSDAMGPMSRPSPDGKGLNDVSSLGSPASAVTAKLSSVVESEWLSKRNDGRVGLDNLGNTCYLNSSLQALLHTEPLVEYFFKQYYLQDVNRTSKFGYGGRLAHVFAALTRDIWLTEKPYLLPRGFHAEMTALAPQFSGNGQHDAQEVLAWMLDGLSEDLNLVSEKPYIEQPDSNGRADEELANEWWANHLQRDNSIVQALFSGQFKSVMRCTCGYSSARFEAFSFLSLPLPENAEKLVTAFVIPPNENHAIECLFAMSKNATVSDYADKIYVADVLQVGEEREKDTNAVSDSPKVILQAAAVRNCRVVAFLPSDFELTSIADADSLFFFAVQRFKVPGKGNQQSQGQHVDWESEDMISRNESELVPASGHASNSIQMQRSVESTSAVTQSEEPSDNDNHDTSTTAFSPILPPPTHHSASKFLKRIIFAHRRPELQEDAGSPFYRMEPFGLPIVEYIEIDSSEREAAIACKDLYALIAKRTKGFLSAPVSLLESASRSISRDDCYVGTKATANYKLQPIISQAAMKATADSLRKTAPMMSPRAHAMAAAKDLSRQASSGSIISAGDRGDWADQCGILPVDTDECVGGMMPENGFVLRLMLGGSASSTGCSRCPWLNGCQGCLIPDDETEIIIADDEIIAIDWHYLVLQEILDEASCTDVRKHSSVESNSGSNRRAIPFSKCFEKFTEEEKLEGVVCPRCKEDTKMSKSLTLWRTPPVLIIQLKRFQFDRFTKRKLTDKVDYPIDGLDLKPFFANSKFEDKEHVNKAGSEGMPGERNGKLHDSDNGQLGHGDSIEETNIVDAITSEDFVEQYDLFCIVHHLGVMGEGHYVTTVREPDDASDGVGDTGDGEWSSGASGHHNPNPKVSPASPTPENGGVHAAGETQTRLPSGTLNMSSTDSYDGGGFVGRPSAGGSGGSMLNKGKKLSATNISYRGQLPPKDIVSGPPSSSHQPSQSTSSGSASGRSAGQQNPAGTAGQMRNCGKAHDCLRGSKRWVCLNDNVSTLMDSSELTGAPTAYLLFYMRRDAQGKDVSALFSRGKNVSATGPPGGLGSKAQSESPYLSPQRSPNRSPLRMSTESDLGVGAIGANLVAMGANGLDAVGSGLGAVGSGMNSIGSNLGIWGDRSNRVEVARQENTIVNDSFRLGSNDFT
jgi:ubiquitin C-terminal hydrolase